MVELDIDRLLADFFQQAESYIAEPNIIKALELDRAAGQASSACSTRYGTKSGITGRFTEFMQALPRQDPERLRKSLDEIRRLLDQVAPRH